MKIFISVLLFGLVVFLGQCRKKNVFRQEKSFLRLSVSVDRSSSSVLRKRYYDAWEGNNDVGGSLPFGKASRKHDLCENKPLWFLKNQARLGKISPFHDCLVELGLE